MNIFSKVAALTISAIVYVSVSFGAHAAAYFDEQTELDIQVYAESEVLNPEEGYLKQRSAKVKTWYDWGDSKRSSKQVAINWWKTSTEHACFVPPYDGSKSTLNDLHIKVGKVWSYYPTLLDVLSDVEGETLTETENEVFFAIVYLEHRLGQASALVATNDLTENEATIQKCGDQIN